MIIGLDAGHGGTNIGCRYFGIKEEVYTLEMALLTATMLVDAGLACQLSRAKDETVSFPERAARLKNCDFILVLHVNAAANAPDAKDLRTYVLPRVPLAIAVAAEIERVAPPIVKPKIPAPTLVAKADPNTVRAYNTVANYGDKPAVLVEMFFATHEPSARWAATPEGKTAIAQTLAAGCVHAWHLSHTDSTPPPAGNTTVS